MTVYGPGYVEGIRVNELHNNDFKYDIIVRLYNWALAQGQSPTLYLNPDSVVKVPGAKVGQSLRTVYGMVKVEEIRRDGTHVCTALHWNLADGKAPRLYLAPEAFALLSLKP